MVRIGHMNTLKVLQKAAPGFYLDGKEHGKILLPGSLAPRDLEGGDLVDVFLYYDSEDRLIATPQEPKACVGEFATLKVVDLTPVGAFLDWGLPKDLLVPFRQQQQRMKKDQYYIVYIYLDAVSNRIAASSKLNQFISKETPDYRPKQKVSFLVQSTTDIGYRVIVDDQFWGMLYYDRVIQPLATGERYPGFVDKVREDGKIDLFLDSAQIDDLAQKILNTLKKKGGRIALSDASPPEEIYEMFGVSKKRFKKAIGALYKRQLIRIGERNIRLRDRSGLE